MNVIIRKFFKLFKRIFARKYNMFEKGKKK